jgi:hypothetical protein
MFRCVKTEIHFSRFPKFCRGLTHPTQWLFIWKIVMSFAPRCKIRMFSLGDLGGLVNQSGLGGFPHEELVFVEDVPEALPGGRFAKIGQVGYPTHKIFNIHLLTKYCNYSQVYESVSVTINSGINWGTNASF